jgi:N6-adenosine-specific RNA methylase IME4
MTKSENANALSATDVQGLAIFVQNCMEPGEVVDDAIVDEAWRAVFEPQRWRLRGMGSAHRARLVKIVRAELSRLQSASARAPANDAASTLSTSARAALRRWAERNIDPSASLEAQPLNPWEDDDLVAAIAPQRKKLARAELDGIKAAAFAELRRLHAEFAAPDAASVAAASRAAADGPEQGALVKLGDATRLLAEVHDATSAKQVMDVAAAAEIYARKQKLGEDAVRYATGIKLEAERKLGQYLRSTERAPAGRPKKIGSAPELISAPTPPTLADLGIPKKLASEAQRLAAIPDELFEPVRRGEVKLGAALRDQRKAELPTRIAAIPAGSFRVWYSDCPWQYSDDRAGVAAISHTAAARQYPTMSTDALCAMGPEVRDHCAADAVHFMWAVFPLLEDALRVMAAWGFGYRTSYVWDKETNGPLGNYHDASAELLLVGVRGSCPVELEERPLPAQVQRVARAGHSEKPEHFRELIDRLYPSGPRVELFRRGDAPPGWVVWGNEAVTDPCAQGPRPAHLEDGGR